jgi:hypothetical protein
MGHMWKVSRLKGGESGSPEHIWERNEQEQRSWGVGEVPVMLEEQQGGQCD